LISVKLNDLWMDGLHRTPSHLQWKIGNSTPHPFVSSRRNWGRFGGWDASWNTAGTGNYCYKVICELW